MKIFKRKTKVTKLADGRIVYEHPKKSKGRVFLDGLRKAVKYNKDKEEYRENFLAILEKADDPQLIREARMRYRTLLENLEKAEKKRLETVTENTNELTLTSLEASINSDGFGLASLEAAIRESKRNPDIYIQEKFYNQLENFREPKKPNKTNKMKMWFKKIKLNIKETWELTKEFGREIQYWLIAEYKIFTKLSYALNRKKDEVNVRKVLKHEKSHMINEYGYDKGTQYLNSMAFSINNSVRLHKRMEKIGL